MGRSIASRIEKGARKAVVFLVGSTVVLFGVVLLFTPGPAVVVIPAGLVILATEFLWARRLLARIRAEGETAAKGFWRWLRKDKCTEGDRMETMKILFLCTGNSCRSQMAEGWAKALKSEVIEAYSAGTESHGLNPLAVRAMAEAGIDISAHHSKTVADLGDEKFDVVITVCDRARESCPIFPGAVRKIHAGFDDPPRLAQDAADEEEAMTHYRRVRDEIRDFVHTLPEALRDGAAAPREPR